MSTSVNVSSDAQLSPGSFVSPSRFHHVGIKTARIKEMVEWYATVLGTEMVADLGFAQFVTYDAANHRVVFFGSDKFEGETEVTRTGLHHLAYEYGELDDLLDTYTRLKGLEILPVWVTDHGPTISFYYEDPDRNLIELQVDNFGSDAGSSAYVRSPPFRDNPLGKDVDPDKLIAARSAGGSHADLHKRAWEEEFLPAQPTPPPGLPPL
jgi:catechol 2,3-dioxygenase